MPTPRPRVIVSLRPECPGAFDARPHPSQIVTCIYRYFSFRIAFSPESKFTADRAYIHVCAPHALFPIGGLLWQLSPWKTSRYHGRAGVASAVTHLPLWRQLFYALGCVPAERRVLSSLLSNGYHTGVAIDGTLPDPSPRGCHLESLLCARLLLRLLTP